jgi:hypothetical protein
MDIPLVLQHLNQPNIKICNKWKRHNDLPYISVHMLQENHKINPTTLSFHCHSGDVVKTLNLRGLNTDSFRFSLQSPATI